MSPRPTSTVQPFTEVVGCVGGRRDRRHLWETKNGAQGARGESQGRGGRVIQTISGNTIMEARIAAG